MSIQINTREFRNIQAAVLRNRSGTLNLEALELEASREDEILVRIVATGICHTDINLCENWDDSDGALVPGHEGAGIVEQVGKTVKGIGIGDHVVLSYASCGLCPECLDNRPWACRHFYEANFGFARLDGSNALGRSGVKGHFFGQSSFATHCVASARNAVVVPNNLKLEMLGPLGCGLQTGAGTVMNSLAVPPGAGIAVFGTGGVGLSAVMAARVVGANPIIGIDINPKRLKLSFELGATHIINPAGSDIRSAISGITGHGIDYTVETTGAPDILRLAVDVLNPGSISALLTGASSPAALTEGRKTIQVIQGSAVPQQFIHRLISLYRDGAFPFDRLLKFYNFNDINRAIADAKRGDTIKPVLRISDI